MGILQTKEQARTCGSYVIKDSHSKGWFKDEKVERSKVKKYSVKNLRRHVWASSLSAVDSHMLGRGDMQHHSLPVRS